MLAMLRDQAAITVEGMDTLVAWAGGDATAVDRLRDCEHRADDRKRELREALGVAFTTPLEPEDIFELSRGARPRAERREERRPRGGGDADRARTRRLPRWPRSSRREHASSPMRSPLSGRDGAALATEAATRAAKSQSRLEHVYRRAMSALIGVDDLREIAAKRELYRRLARIGDDLREVAERVWYSVLKES